MEREARVSFRMDFEDQQEVEEVQLEEKEELPSGWSFKISRRLKRFGWKERQELPSGWSFKDRRMLRLEWSVGQRRQRGQCGQVARIT